MHSLEPEIANLGRSGLLDPGVAARLAALEDGRVFPVRRELLLALYGGVAATVAGVGLLVRRNLDQIGPLTLLLVLLAAAGACYAAPIRKALRGEARTLAQDYLLLLGGLLLSSAVGYAEFRFRLFGAHWSLHLLLLAALHAITAYALDSRLLLSVALSAFAGWVGVQSNAYDFLSFRYAGSALGWRMLACGASFLAARELHRRARSGRDFLDVFDHFAANFAFWGALALVFEPATRWTGAALLLALAAVSGLLGYRKGRETLLLYAIGYGAVGLWSLIGQLVQHGAVRNLLTLVTITASALLLWHLRRLMRAGPE
jgi:hypothetical protein